MAKRNMKVERAAKGISGRENTRIPRALKDGDWNGECVLYVPIFRMSVTLFVGDRDTMCWYYEKDPGVFTRNIVDAMPNDERCGGGVAPEGPFVLIWLPKLGDDDDSFLSLCHEALHAALYGIQRIGVEIGERGEILAYLQEHIVNGLLNELKLGRYTTVLPDRTIVPRRNKSGHSDLQDIVTLGKMAREAEKAKGKKA